MQTGLIFSFVICVLLMISCDKSSANLLSSEKQHLHSSHAPHSMDKTHSYQKPGANVRLLHNYSGTSKVGETQNIELIFSEQYQSGQMNVRLIPDTGLMIQPTRQDYIFYMEERQKHPIALSVRAKNAGKYLLKIFASVEDKPGQISHRVMAIAFYVGDSSNTFNKPQTPSPTDKVIILPSQESGN